MKKIAILAAAALAGLSAPAMSTVIVVDALANSSTGGTGKATGLVLASGNLFSVSAALTDLWSSGSLPRWSNANGMTGDLFATGTDESGEAAGTLIGIDHGLWNQNGISAHYGTLVGEIGGIFQALGASFTGAAWASGELTLHYWDSNNVDNIGSVAVNAVAVPEPAAWALMLGGLGVAGMALRRRKVAVSFA